MEFERKIFEFIKEHDLISPEDTLVTGVSGGADSVCLLLVLNDLRSKLPFELIVSHVNHHLREEADKDADFVRQLCRRLGCKLYITDADVSGYVRKTGLSTEEAGRILRYEAFEDALMKAGAPKGKIAVAHTQNDNAETLLFNLMRGSGLRGLGGIRPKRDIIIRPLLCVTRKEVETYLKDVGQDFCTDKTNFQDDYARNKIRHHILNYAEENICTQTVRHIYDTSVILQETESFVRSEAKKGLARCQVRSDDAQIAPAAQDELVGAGQIILSVEAFLREDTFLRKQILMLAIEQVSTPSFGMRDISAAHINAVLALFLREGNGKANLPHGICAVREYSYVRIYLEKSQEPIRQAQRLIIPGVTVWDEGLSFVCDTFPYEKGQDIPHKIYTKWFDYGKIKHYLTLRARQEGDYLAVYGDGRKKLLSDYMKDEKIPQSQRDQMPLIADGNHILWAGLGRISQAYKVSDETVTVLRITAFGAKAKGAADGED